MRNYDNEFNHERIVNEDVNQSFEFGNTPLSESESFSDNKINIRDEVNDNPSSNSENPTEAKKEKQQRKDDSSSNESRENHSSESQSSSTSSTAHASSGAASATGGSVAAVAASSAVVAVAAVSSLVGINVTGGGDFPSEPVEPTVHYGEVLNPNFATFHNKIGYRLKLSPIEGDEYEISLYQQNNVVSSQKLSSGTNANYFFGLNESTDYSVSINNKTKDFVIYTTNLSTIAYNEASASIDDVPDVEAGTFEVMLTYNYNDSLFSEFSLVLTNQAGLSNVYPLDGGDEQISVELISPTGGEEFSFDSNEEYTYSLRYMYDDEEKTSLEKKVTFDTSKTPTKHKITLDSGLADVPSIDEYLREGKSYYLPQNPFNLPDGKIFQGWRRTGSTRIYEPGTKIITYIDQDFTFTAALEDSSELPSFSNINLTNEIDSTENELVVNLTMDFVDPSARVTLLTLKLLNQDETKQSDDQNNMQISLGLTTYQQISLYCDVDKGFDFCNGLPYQYQIYYVDMNTRDTVIVEENEITFVDKNGLNPFFSDFSFYSRSRSADSGIYSVSWVSSYNEDCSSFYQDVSILLEQDGSTIDEISYSGLRPNGEETSFDSYTHPIDYEGSYVYTFRARDLHGFNHDIFKGYVNFNDLESHVSNFSLGSNLYFDSTLQKYYVAVSASISDPSNSYGALYVEFRDENTPDNKVQCPISSRNGTQILDITDFMSNSDVTVSKANIVSEKDLSTYLAEDIQIGDLEVKQESDVPTIEIGSITNYYLSEASLRFDVDLFINNSNNSGTITNVNLNIGSHAFPISMSETSSGYSTFFVEVPTHYEGYSELVNLLKTSSVTITVSYDATYESRTVSNVVTVCDNGIFTVR